MPSYEYECIKCGKVTTFLRPIKNRNDSLICQCGAGTKRILSSFSTITSKGPIEHEGSSHAMKRKDKSSISGSKAIRIDGAKNVSLKDNIISGFDIGISMSDGAKVKMKGNKFVNVRNPIEIRDK